MITNGKAGLAQGTTLSCLSAILAWPNCLEYNSLWFKLVIWLNLATDLLQSWQLPPYFVI